MKIMIDGVFYTKEKIDFKKILEDIVKIVGEDVVVRSIEFPEIGAIVGDAYYYRCGFTLDKEVKHRPEDRELEEMREKIKNLFPKDTVVYSLKCELYE
ncbi:hypothetical protein CFE53_04305 [Methanofervidicoccus sp. A16]|uniref:hypothetical protein n=1 Tax=Methanofervidicoccus sp. A16 TaxID=2607662 RepID=UPI00118906A3|nr:hypothetical protein [Methanofervidicoccus sp. A16]AXI25396.1 hypothetical protein CFE53_04305 [Methanofervidicoccus sp. A16]